MEKDKERQSIRTGVKLLFCLLVSGFVFLIACQAVEPEKRAYPQVIGIDWQKEEQRYTVWMHMASLAEDTGQRKQSAETQPGNELYFTGSDGAQIHTAYEATREQYLDIGHVKEWSRRAASETVSVFSQQTVFRNCRRLWKSRGSHWEIFLPGCMKIVPIHRHRHR